jgi:hypothetical protein
VAGAKDDVRLEFGIEGLIVAAINTIAALELLYSAACIRAPNNL